MSEDDNSDSSPASSTALRPEMIEAAKQFMLNPKVRGTSFENQKKFLLDKGVTECEVEEARKQVPQMDTVPYPQTPYPQMAHYPQEPPPQSIGSKLYSFTQSVVVVGGASYMAYRLMRSWVLPKFFNYPDEEDKKLAALQNQVNELQNSTKFIMDSVEQTLSTVSAQQEQLNRALLIMSGQNGSKDTEIAKLVQDMGVVKSLLLNKSQFPPIPSTSENLNGVLKPVKTVRWQANPSIVPPSWQLASETTNGENFTNGFSSNGHLEEKDINQNEDELFHEAESNGHA
ncbi:hypothetical protein FO519_008960 [Halicephalobus sp. NKZ332]|nr:hypothetical protein FO519_008960 [Halicephalobus sp. NKZ332]